MSSILSAKNEEILGKERELGKFKADVRTRDKRLVEMAAQLRAERSAHAEAMAVKDARIAELSNRCVVVTHSLSRTMRVSRMSVTRGRVLMCG